MMCESLSYVTYVGYWVCGPLNVVFWGNSSLTILHDAWRDFRGVDTMCVFSNGVTYVSCKLTCHYCRHALTLSCWYLLRSFRHIASWFDYAMYVKLFSFKRAIGGTRFLWSQVNNGAMCRSWCNLALPITNDALSIQSELSNSETFLWLGDVDVVVQHMAASGGWEYTRGTRKQVDWNLEPCFWKADCISASKIFFGSFEC